MSALFELIMEAVMEIMTQCVWKDSLYPGEWGVMRYMNLFLLGVALIFLMVAGMIGWMPFWIVAGLFCCGCVARWVVKLAMKQGRG